jgi:polyisoprenoid-binding protein YceI
MPFNLFGGEPQQQAQLALAAGLLESGGPSRHPVGLGQGAARGMMQGQEAFMRAQQAQQKQKFFELQMQQFEAAKAQEAQRAAALAQLSQDPRFLGLGALLQVDPSAAIKHAYPEPKVVAPGASLVAPNAPQVPLFTAPERPSTPSSIREYEYAKSQGYPGTFQQFQAEQNAAKASKVDVKVPVNLAQDNYAKTVGTKTAERDITQHDIATSAVENVTKLNNVVAQLESGQPITGIAAELQLDFERAKAKFLQDKEAGQKVTDTEYLRALLGSDVFPMIKSLGIGARGLDTPAEREFLISVMTGAIPMTKETLLRMTKDRRDKEIRSIKSWNDRVERGELDRYFEAQGVGRQTVSIPEIVSSQPSPKPAAMTSMPPAAQHKGKTIRDTKTGKMFRSDGMTWRPL